MQVTFTELGTVTQRFPHLRVNKLFTELAVCDITLFCRCVCSVFFHFLSCSMIWLCFGSVVICYVIWCFLNVVFCSVFDTLGPP